MKTETLVGLTILLAALLSVGAYQAGVGLSGRQIPVPVAGQSAGTSVKVSADGPALFGANCAGCHGAQAQGAVGPKLAGLSWTVPQFAQAVRDGQAPAGRALAPMMPHFRTAGFDGDPPTDEQLTAVLAFLKKL
ncbi:c-type cytochrome [Deinococcus sp. UYEF24]